MARRMIHLVQKLTLGQEERFSVKVHPDLPLAPRRLLSNIPCPETVLDVRLRLRNEEIAIGDAWKLRTTDEPSPLTYLPAMPLTPQDAIEIEGHYTGATPPGYREGSEFTLIFTVIGDPKEEEDKT